MEIVKITVADVTSLMLHLTGRVPFLTIRKKLVYATLIMFNNSFIRKTSRNLLVY